MNGNRAISTYQVGHDVRCAFLQQLYLHDDDGDLKRDIQKGTLQEWHPNPKRPRVGDDFVSGNQSRRYPGDKQDVIIQG